MLEKCGKGLIVFGFLLFSFCKLANGKDLDSVIIEKKSKLIVLPAITHSPVTRWGVGIGSSLLFKSKQSDTTIRTSNAEGLVLCTQNKQYLGVLGLNMYSPNETYILHWRNSFSYFPDRFWGLGNNTKQHAFEHYTFEQFLINPQILRRLYKELYIGANYEFQNVFKFGYNKGGLFDQENIVGRNGGIISGLGMSLAWDTRNNAFSSTKGVYLQLNFIPYRRWLGSDFHFNYVNVDLRKYISIYKGHVLAFQMIGLFNKGDVPIRNLAALGGSEIMRGYYAGRYRDKDLIAAQTEYRSPLLWRFGLAFFGGLGEVSENIREFKGKLKYSLGGGLRFSLRKHERLNLRVDYGVGNKSSGLYFTVAEAF
jgi:outer membrane protein assembly factor BamA